MLTRDTTAYKSNFRNEMGNMEPWEQAARHFIDICSFKDDIETVFLTGSHAFGNADEFSDIDLFIVLNDRVKYRERGNKKVAGFRIEYFANPVREVIKTIDNRYANAELNDINMILGGVVIFDKNEISTKLMSYCREKLESEIPKMSPYDVIMGLYLFWDNFDELGRAYKKQTPDFAMQYFRFVQNAFEMYSRFTCSPVPGYHKMHKWLTDNEYIKKYGLPEHKDPDFIKIIKPAFECDNTDAMYELSKKLYEYVTEKMGGIDIDNFVMHGPCD